MTSTIQRDRHFVFEFSCQCGAEGELGVPVHNKSLVECPDRCGALFSLRRPVGMFGSAELVEVLKGGRN